MTSAIEVNNIEYKLDLKPSLPSLQDWQFVPPEGLQIPDNMDLKPWFTYDQAQEGACTGNAQAKLMRMLASIQGLQDFHPSRSWIYAISRIIEGTLSTDSGSSIADSMKGLNQYGVCSEEDFPYVAGQFAVPPPQSLYPGALDHQLLKYELVGQTQDSIGAALALNHPVSVGAVLYANFTTLPSSGIVPMPQGGVIGAHNFLLTGRILSQRVYIMDNSWGTNWGITIPGSTYGRAYIPFDYIHNPNLAFEVRTGDLVEGAPTPTPQPPTPAESKEAKYAALFSTGQFMRMGWKYSDLSDADKAVLRAIVAQL